MADYRTYLASAILTEDKHVTYRLLSRALKINVNTAKEMLYEFHRTQNAKKPGTIHATYLLSGIKRPHEPKPIGKDSEGDDYMQSSPPMGSSMPHQEQGTGETGVLSITLVREENLDEMRAQYEEISSIHVYSIGPHSLKDLQVLSDITRQIQELCASEDPLEFAPKYGTIVNENVRRRTDRRPAASLPPAPVPAKPQPTKSKMAESKEVTKAIQKEETKHEKPSSANNFFGGGKGKGKGVDKKNSNSNPSSKESTPAPDGKPPTLKRDSSSIFKSFAKTKQPKAKREDSNTSTTPVASPVADDSAMGGMSEDDDEEDTFVVPKTEKKSREIVDSDRKSRKEREAALKRMMEDDEDEEGQEEMKEATPAEEETEKAKLKEPSPEKEAISVDNGGRRRGRRRVIKKNRVEDEEGFLVTKEEPVWESFSEDEPVAPPKAKAKLQSSIGPTKGKKPAAKVAQGNIMSFFGKK